MGIKDSISRCLFYQEMGARARHLSHNRRSLIGWGKKKGLMQIYDRLHNLKLRGS